jgi:plastocyanin
VRRLLVTFAAAALLAGQAPARAAPIEYLVVGGPGSWLSTYTTPVAVTAVGGPLRYIHLDAQIHDVVAYDAFRAADKPWCSEFPAGKCPLFWSDLLTLGETTLVQGLEDVEAGKAYAFFCTRHQGMRGTLVVLP